MIRTVMTLGDSITWGYMSTDGTGYRTELNQDLAAAGITPNFVGSQFDGTYQNEGHPGWQINDIAANVDSWLASTSPQIITLMIGTNDVDSYDSNSTPLGPDGAPARLQALIDKITTDEPNADLFVATIPPDAFNGFFPVDPYNAALKSVVSAEEAAGKHVFLTDVNAHMTTADLSSDGIHPNDAGYIKIGDAFAASIEQVLGGAGSGITPPPGTNGAGGSSAPPSPDGTVVVGTNGAIVTAAGNSFAIAAGGQITENGSVLSVTHSVTELAYVNHTLYQEATSQNLWWSLNETNGQWAQSSSPLSAPTASPPPTQTQSAGTINLNNPTSSGMVLTFDDEFNSNTTSSDNAASGTLWSNHLWYDGANPGAISVSNGVLNLASGGELSSVNSAGQGFAQKYGYFEIDMKVPAGVGTWPAFWLMSQQHAVNGANPASEIDIIEGQGNKPFGYYTTLHSNTGSGQDQVNPMPNYTGDISTTDMSAGFHRYGVLWAPDSNQLTYYFDGRAVGTSTKYSTTDYSPDMLLIDNWLGDIGWGGNSPTGQNYGPLQIDYVRTYQFTGQGATAINAQAVSPGAGQTDATALANATGGGTSVAPDPIAQAPHLSVANASGGEGSSIPLSIAASQASSALAPADLTVTVSNLNGATLNHGTLANGVYTLHAADLSGLTVTPGSTFTGTLALHVTATDQEATSTASSAMQTLNVSVTAPTSSGSGGSTGSSFNPQTAGMVLTFDDEFNAASISSDGAANHTLWNNHLWYEAANPGGVSVANGVATLASGGDLSTIDSAGQGFSQKFGYFEAKVAFTGGAGDVPAFWLMNAQKATSASAPGTDIDVLHAQTSDPTHYTASVQSDAGQADNSVGSNVINLTQGSHTYGVLWAPNATNLIWYLDGQQVATTAAPADLSSGAAMLNLSFYPGSGTNAPTSGSNPSMQVDWVHVYQYASQGPTAVTPQTGFSEGPQAIQAQAPHLSVANASGGEGSSIPLSIAASQASSALAPADLTVTVSNLNGATLNHGTLANGVYTLHAADLSGLTVTPGSTFTGTLALHVTATDQEATSTASSAMQTLNVSVTAPTSSGSGGSTGSTGSSFNPQTAGMVLTFDDEFNAASISSDGAANHTLWNNHLWYEAANPGGVSVANGVATLASGGDLSTIDSAGQGFSQKFGYFEAKVAFTGGAGDVPAFWLMNAQKATSASAPGTDIDVLHAQTSDPTHYTASVQSDAGQADNSVGSNVINLTQGSHTYGVLWAPNATNLIWYLDGQQVATTAAPADLSSGAAMLNLSFYPGSGTNAPTSGSNPSMQVDWVHVYQYASQGPTAVTPQTGFSEGSGTSTDPSAHAMAPMLAVFQASGTENGSIPLFIQASQASSALSSSHLSITVSGIGNATLNHGTETNGVYTLHASDLSGLTLTPAANFTGTLALHVTATDTETSTTASSVTATLNVAVTGPATGGATMLPSFSDGDHSLYLLNSLSTGNAHIASFNPATDILDVAPLLNMVGYKGTNPIADHIVNLEAASNGGTAVMIDPTGASLTHGTTVVTLDHVLPQNVPATDIWH